MAEPRSRITGRVEEWWKEVCIRHNCKYYIHEDYSKCSYCTCSFVKNAEKKSESEVNNDNNNT